jgi:hypothetical protein
MAKTAAFTQYSNKMKKSKCFRDGLILSLATLFWAFITWGSYQMVIDGMNAEMMKYEGLSAERHKQIWWLLVRETFQVNLLVVCILITIGIFLVWCWRFFLRAS